MAWQEVGLMGLNRKAGQGRTPILSVSNATHTHYLNNAVEAHAQNVKAIQRGRPCGSIGQRIEYSHEFRYGKALFKKNNYSWRRIRRCTHQGQNKVDYADKHERLKLLLTLWILGYIELYFGDESGFTMYPYVPYEWQKKGMTQPHRRPGSVCPKTEKPFKCVWAHEFIGSPQCLL